MTELLTGLRVDYTDADDPVLVRPDGSTVDTWRENYPYEQRMERKEYDWHKRLQQIELLKLQRWVKETGRRLVIVCEGRDAVEQGRHDQTVHRAPEPARRPRGGVGEAERARERSVVLPALRPAPADHAARSCCSTGPGTTGRAWSA